MILRPHPASLVLAALCLLPASAAVAEDWSADIRAVDELARAANWSEAQAKVKKLMRRMPERLGTQENAAYVIALVCVYRAIAEKGLGDEAAASWYWHVAEALSPGITRVDMSPYGEVALALQDQPAPEIETDATGIETAEPTPPRCSGRPPRYPGSLRLRGGGSRLTLQVIIDQEGNLWRPDLLSRGNGPAEEFVAFEALRSWTCEPARIESRPISVVYSVTVDFR